MLSSRPRRHDREAVGVPKPKPRPRRLRVPEHSNHERWLVSYADFITLLFAVFATMYALSVVDAKKFAALAEGLRSAFNESAPSAVGSVLANQKSNSPSARKPGAGGIVDLGEVRAKLEQRLAKAIGANQVEMEMDHRGLVISIREAGSFATSRAELSATAQDILTEIGVALANVGNSVRIEGHTDDVPIHSDRFESNWELSTARATMVVRFMVERARLQPQRLSAAGYAEFMPRVPGVSDAARARNRRVDLIVLSKPTQAAEEPVASTGHSLTP